MAVKLENLGAITMFVADVARAKEFYEAVFGWRVVFEDDQSVMFDCGNTIVNLLLESEAPGLIAPAPVALRSAGSRFQLTIWVEDTDRVVAELRTKGIDILNGPIDRPWGQRTATVTDPDGHIWEFAQNIQHS